MHHAYIHAFNLIGARTGRLGPKGLKKISDRFGGDFLSAWDASESELREAGLSEETVAAITEHRNNIYPENEYAGMPDGIRAIGINDPEYPALLKEIPYPPFLLYVRGELPAQEMTLAIVGTRIPTSYGKEVTGRIARELAASGIAIVSGLALGIDGIAHEAVVKARGKTVAVLGSGIDDDSIYPVLHKPLARQIIKGGGAIISEFPPGTRATKYSFPQRNRIIAGMSRGTIVTEAKIKSGALITARYALDSNRDVFAVPGPIVSSASEGPHALIQEGATLVQNAQTILENYGLNRRQTEAEQENLTDLERHVLSILETPLPFDEISEKIEADASAINTALSSLELAECIKNIGNRTYVRLI